MYSVVMMMALSGGAEVPDFGWRCCGCCGGWTCSGCWGCGGCGGCCGGWHRCGWHRCWRFHRCCGCCGGFVTCGCVGGDGYGAPVMPNVPLPTKAPGKTFYPSEVSQNSETPHVFVNYQPTAQAKPATVIVNLPAQAKLTFNGWTSANNSTTRRFRTPALETGEEFAYTIRAEIVRDGQTLVQNHQVVVRGGQETRVNIEFPTVVLSQHQE